MSEQPVSTWEAGEIGSLEIAPCPLCGGESITPLTVGDQHNVGLVTVLCDKCGQGFLRARPTQAWYEAFYRDAYWPRYFRESREQLQQAEVKHAQSILSTLENAFSSPEKVALDFGCALGGMLSAMKEIFPDVKACGYEESTEAGAYCRSNGFDVIDRDLGEIVRRYEGKCDLITSVNGLNRFARLGDCLAAIAACLSPTGQLILQLPDLSSDALRGIQFFQIAHVNYFTPQSIHRALARHGIKVDSIEHDPEGNGTLMTIKARKSAKAPEVSECGPEELQAILTNVAECCINIKASPNSKDSVQQRKRKKPLTRVSKAIFTPIIRKFSRILYQADPVETLERLAILEKKVNALEIGNRETLRRMEVMVMAQENADLMWLYQNREHRMDANVPNIFKENRRQFHKNRYRFASALTRGRRVADIACGVGYGSHLLLHQGGAESVTGIDLDNEAVAYASRAYGDPKIQFLCASGDQTPLETSSIDAVASFETIEHVPSDSGLLAEFHRILRPGGILICSTPNDWPVEDAEFHVRSYDLKAFEAAIEQYFQIKQMFNQNSGADWRFNHHQAPGITATTPKNQLLAECYIVVAEKK
ncbi:methyltransferase domain-containing protein [Blastopirellula sp. J2-11]|uniref:class I SAM-dependent methyltransferase n=1 Tax=Blastopirellula sp. J2-11 TaxID=2943192 RepID=UPI0021C6C451|nr:methyltransferase domain-containing protein [Blastopirellula sp. J2-11]UUO06620.1 methyltransferase domain-containing protein [Blastopirellula sp. J2-11]